MLLATLTPTAAANVDFLNVFSSSYDNYLIIGDGLKPSSIDSTRIHLAVAGVVDSGSNYTLGMFNSSTPTTSTSMDLVENVYPSRKGECFSLRVMNANDEINLKVVESIVTSSSSSTNWSSNQKNFAYFAANKISGVRFSWKSGSNFAATGKIRVYGYSNT